MPGMTGKSWGRKGRFSAGLGRLRVRVDPVLAALYAMRAVSLGVALVGLTVLIHGLMYPHPQAPKPGPEWQRDHGSVYWSCTSGGHALLRDADTGAVTLDREDRRCDAAG